MMTALIAAWIKKQKFAEKINEIDKYLVEVNRICEEIDLQFALTKHDRLPYNTFKQRYVPAITEFSKLPVIPPDEWKRCIKEITMNYPELIEPDNREENKLWPWFGDYCLKQDLDGKVYRIRKQTLFMKYMLRKNNK